MPSRRRDRSDDVTNRDFAAAEPHLLADAGAYPSLLVNDS
jgi:hypothetical protein